MLSEAILSHLEWSLLRMKQCLLPDCPYVPPMQYTLPFRLHRPESNAKRLLKHPKLSS